MTAHIGALAEPRAARTGARGPRGAFVRALAVGLTILVGCAAAGATRIGGEGMPWAQLQLTLGGLSVLLLIDRSRELAASAADEQFRVAAFWCAFAWLALQTVGLTESVVDRSLPVVAGLLLVGVLLVCAALCWRTAIAGRFSAGKQVAIALDSIAVFFTFAAALTLVLRAGGAVPHGLDLPSLSILFLCAPAAAFVPFLALSPARRLDGWLPILVGLPIVGAGLAWRMLTESGPGWQWADAVASFGILVAGYGAATWTDRVDPSERYRKFLQRVRTALPIAAVVVAPLLLVVNEVLLDVPGIAIRAAADLSLTIVIATYPVRRILLAIERGRRDHRTEVASARERRVVADPSPSEQRTVREHDLQRERARERQLDDEADHDALTGLANRTPFVDRVSLALAHQREDDELALVLIDLDDFTAVNDSLGHGAGDQALVAVSERLRACVRPNDTIARLHGDEFAVLLEQADPTIVGRITGSLLETLRVPFQIDGERVQLTASIGVGVANSSVRESAELLRNADSAVSTAKQNGKGRVELFEASMRAAVQNRLELRAGLERAVERDEFVLDYQPVYELTNGMLNSFEALLTWRHPRRGEVTPAEFIGLAEETGLVVPIGRWVLETACRQAIGWAAAGRPDLAVAVKLSARELHDPLLITNVADVLGRVGLPAERLVLELAESSLRQDDEKCLQALRALGLRIAIDHFGAGHSSLSHLVPLPIQILKVDRSFIALLGHEGEDRKLVGSVMQLAAAMHMATIAEGIERPEQLADLEAMGCMFGQGHLLAKPMSADEAAALVASSARRQ